MHQQHSICNSDPVLFGMHTQDVFQSVTSHPADVTSVARTALQGLTPHLSAMSPLDAVSLQMAAVLASNFASPGPLTALCPLPAPGLPPQRQQHEPPWPGPCGSGRGLSEHAGLRQGMVGLPPVHHSGPASAMGTTSSAGVIAAARRAVAAAAKSGHGDFGAMSYPEQQQRQQQQQQRSGSVFGYRPEVSDLIYRLIATQE